MIIETFIASRTRGNWVRRHGRFCSGSEKTIDAQADKSPELRQRVYAKARATIEQKLVTANASQVVAVRQRKILEDAIEEVEAFYAPPASKPVVEEPQTDPLEDFLHESTRSTRMSSYDDEGPVSTEPRYSDSDVDSGDDTAPVHSRNNDDWAVERDRDGSDDTAYARRGNMQIEMYAKKSAPIPAWSLVLLLFWPLALEVMSFGPTRTSCRNSHLVLVAAMLL